MPCFPSYDGTLLAYHEKGDGPPLLCLPGGPAQASVYLGDLGGLPAHHRLILLDLRGSGESAVPADPATYRCDRAVEDVEALRRHLDLDRVDLLAHCAGANLALLYAARYPERVGGLVLVGPSWRATDLEFTVGEWFAVMRRRSGEPWFEEAFAAMQRMEAGTGTEADRISAARLVYGRWTPEARAHVVAGPSQVNPEARAGFGVAGAYGDPAATRAALKALTAPVLLLGGDLDPAPTPRLLEDFAAMFNDATVIIQPEAGHLPWLDDAELFVNTVTRFLSVRPAGSPARG